MKIILKILVAIACYSIVPLSASTIEVNDSTFHQTISNNAIAVVDVYANWCVPCKKIAPYFKKVSEEFSSQAVFVKVDIDKSKKTATNLGVKSIPTIIIFKNGREWKRHVGSCDLTTLRNFVSSAI